MPGNRSLDEFVGAEAADEEPVESVTPAADPIPSESTDDLDSTAEAVEPIAETFAWSPTGGECAVCGAGVEERWRDGADLVCGECKAW